MTVCVGVIVDVIVVGVVFFVDRCVCVGVEVRRVYDDDGVGYSGSLLSLLSGLRMLALLFMSLMLLLFGVAGVGVRMYGGTLGVNGVDGRIGVVVVVPVDMVDVVVDVVVVVSVVAVDNVDVNDDGGIIITVGIVIGDAGTMVDVVVYHCAHW